MDFDIEPMGSTVVNVPDDTAEYENETFIRFIFTAKEDTDYCEMAMRCALISLG